MKDIPHHMADFIKNYSKSENPQEDKVLEEFEKEHPLRQQKKQRKAKERKEKLERTPEPLTPDDCNKKMKKRTPKLRDRAHNRTF